MPTFITDEEWYKALRESDYVPTKAYDWCVGEPEIEEQQVCVPTPNLDPQT